VFGAISCWLLWVSSCWLLGAISCWLLWVSSCWLLGAISCWLLWVSSCWLLGAISCWLLWVSSCWLLGAICADLDLLLEEVLDRGVIEYALGCFRGVEPGVAHGAGGPPVGALVGSGLVDELVRHDWAFQGGDDVAQRQLARITGELVAAVRTPYAVDNAYSSEAAQ